MNKEPIRTQLKKIRKHLNTEQIDAWSQLIFFQLSNLKEFRSAQRIAAFAPLRGEVNILLSLINEPNKTIYLPVIQANTSLAFYPYNHNTTLIKNKYQILEPHPESSEIAPEHLDLILIPMLGFDLQGYRLGMGQGYYDRYLANLNTTTKLGLAFSCQACPSLPHQEHDVKMNIILTEKNIFHFKDES